jgi:hypothetical protein
MRSQYYNKKIIGGAIGGGIFDSVTKLVLTKLPSLLNIASQGAAHAAGSRLASKMIGDSQIKVVKHDITPEMKEVINSIANTPEIKNVLTDKTKQILNEDSRAILSNIISGSGKRRGGGFKRINFND